MTWEWQVVLVVLTLSNIVLCLAWSSSQRRLAATSELARMAIRKLRGCSAYVRPAAEWSMVHFHLRNLERDARVLGVLDDREEMTR